MPPPATRPTALADALARSVPIDTVALAPPRRRDASVVTLDVPPTTRVGERVPVRISLHSSDATNATVTVSIDGVAHSSVVVLPAGDTVLSLQQPIETPGLHTFRVRVETPGDAVPQNNSLDAATVAAPPRTCARRRRQPYGRRAAGGHIRRGTSSMSIRCPPEYAPRRRRVWGLRRGRARRRIRHQSEPRAAARAARRRPRRSRVAGRGRHRLGAGNYARSPLEDALPVRSITTPHRVRTPVALMLVIDKSGSMMDEVHGVAKVDMVKVAAASAVDQLGDGDALGVLAFDDTTYTIVPFHVLHGAADKASARQEIGGISASGSTIIYPALQEAERNVLRVATPNRHIVLLTDGQGEDAPFTTLIQRMHREHITLSTIGVGTDVVQDELRQWAQLGGGAFHYVADPHEIPRIVVDETHFGVASSAAVQARIPLGVSASSPLLRALSNTALPPIAGYDTTRPKPAAQVSVQTAKGDPLLASWQYGLGRAVAWMSDTGTSTPVGGWAGQWSATRLPTFGPTRYAGLCAATCRTCVLPPSPSTMDRCKYPNLCARRMDCSTIRPARALVWLTPPACHSPSRSRSQAPASTPRTSRCMARESIPPRLRGPRKVPLLPGRLPRWLYPTPRNTPATVWTWPLSRTLLLRQAAKRLRVLPACFRTRGCPPSPHGCRCGRSCWAWHCCSSPSMSLCVCSSCPVLCAAVGTGSNRIECVGTGFSQQIGEATLS